MDNLEEFLKGNDEQPVVETETPQEPETQVTEAPAPEAEAEEPKGPVRDEKGRFAPKGETQEASPASPEPQLDHAALIGERRRRQEAEDRIRALEEQFAKLQTPQAEPQGPPDRWEDPEGYDQWLVQRASQAAEERAIHAVQQQRIYESAVRARGKYADYDAAHATFGEMVQVNPALFQQMVSASDPAEFAYQAAKREIEIRQHGSLDALIDAKVAERLAAQAPAPTTPSIPDTLADAQSSRGSGAQPMTVPSLDEILRR